MLGAPRREQTTPALICRVKFNSNPLFAVLCFLMFAAPSFFSMFDDVRCPELPVRLEGSGQRILGTPWGSSNALLLQVVDRMKLVLLELHQRMLNYEESEAPWIS